MTNISLTDIKSRVRTVIADSLKVNVNLLFPENRFFEDLGVDSLDKVSLLVMLENEFGMAIPDEDALSFTCVGEVEKYIVKRISK